MIRPAQLGGTQPSHQFHFQGPARSAVRVICGRRFPRPAAQDINRPHIEPAPIAGILHPDSTLPDEIKALRFTATYTPRAAGSYLFLTAGGSGDPYLSGQDKYKLFVNGTQIAAMAPFEMHAPLDTYRDLPAGTPVEIRFDYIPGSRRAYPRVAISAIAGSVPERAKQIAATSDVVVLALGFDATTDT